MAIRSTQDVLDSHLTLRGRGDVEQNDARHVVLLSAEGVVRGHAAVRERKKVTATSKDARVHDGVDTFCGRGWADRGPDDPPFRQWRVSRR